MWGWRGYHQWIFTAPDAAISLWYQPPPSHRNFVCYGKYQEIFPIYPLEKQFYFYKYLFWNISSRLFPHPVSETNPRQLLAQAIYTRFLSFKNNNGHVLSHKLKCIIPRHFWGWHKKRKQMWKPRAVLWGRGIAAWSVFIAGSVSDAVTYQCIYRGHQSSPALFFNPHQEKGY